jgi:hypothetical protein
MRAALLMMILFTYKSSGVTNAKTVRATSDNNTDGKYFNHQMVVMIKNTR